MAVQISTNVEFIQANTTTNAGFILLPSTTTLAGRLLTIKDTAGTFGLRPLTLSTIGNDRFEEGVNLKRLLEPFGYITLASDGVNRWYTIDGTSMNTYTISTLTNPISISTQSIFTSSVTVSTLGFEDRDFNSVSSFYTRSTLLYLGSNIIGGSKCGPTLFVPTRRPFQPNQLTSFQLWLDAADVNTIRATNNSVTFWRDKSGNSRNAGQVLANAPLFILSSSVARNPAIRFTNSVSSSQSLGISPLFQLGATNVVYMFAVFNMNAATYNAPFGGYLLAHPGFDCGMVLNYSFASVPNLYPTFYNPANTTFIGGAITTVSYNTSYIWSAAFLGAANEARSWINGGTQITQTNASLGGTLNTTRGALNIGNANNIDVCELLVYQTTLTDAQRQQVEGYLAWKWGLVGNLPSTHPYKTAPP